MYLYCCEGCKLGNSLGKLRYLSKIKNIVLYVYVQFPIEEIKF